ncbi:MAG: hypothetical protein EOM18_10530 [Clostridia bacterium]|nr:hypothetical protein [Clostridia bacterium]
MEQRYRDATGKEEREDMKTDKDQKRMLWIWTAVILGVAVFYIGFTSHYLWQNKEKTDIEWEERVHAFETLSDEEQGSTKDAVRVGVTTYLENVTDIDIRQSTFDADMQIIFTWKKGSRLNGEELGSMLGHFSVYNGKITDIETQESSVSEDGICIQKIKVSAQISNKLETVRFPLNSYQLRIYIVPRESIEKMIWIPDGENSSSNPNLSLAGFRLERLATNSYYRRTEENVSYDGELIDDQERVYSEVLTAMEFNRSTLGLYLKFINFFSLGQSDKVF